MEAMEDHPVAAGPSHGSDGLTVGLFIPTNSTTTYWLHEGLEMETEFVENGEDGPGSASWNLPLMGYSADFRSPPIGWGANGYILLL